jgi:hypothetical protein
VDGVVRVVAVVLAKVGDAVVRAVDAAPVKVDGAKVGAARARVEEAHAKVGAARARAEEALVKVEEVRADADPVREASRHVIRRLLRNRVPRVPRGA